MEIKILNEHPNPLLKRREFAFEVSHPSAASPKRDEVRGEIAKLAKAPKDRVVIERMRARYGTATTRGEAMVYETAEAVKSTEREHILVRNGLKEKAAKAATPAAAETPATPSAPAAPAAPAPASAEPVKKE